MTRRRKIELTSAGLIATISLFAAFAPAGQARLSAPSEEASAMIMGPLLAEYGIAGRGEQPAARAPNARQFTNEVDRGLAWSQGRGADAEASRFARSVIDARASAPAQSGQGMESLAAFSGRSAVLAERADGGGQLLVAVYDSSDTEGVVNAFQSDYVEAGGLVLAGERPDQRAMALRYEARLDSPGGFDGLDIGLSPRAGVSFSDTSAAAEAGATLRLGQYLGEYDGSSRPAWWFFAGADRQALLFDPSDGFDLREAFTMEPYAVVGDAQAGVAVRMGAADISLAYIHRETVYSLPNDSWETSEGFAAFTLSFQR
ncbi:MAG: lipid A-modifier LpxR family protein [Pseudomonadota bacterium]